MKSFYFDLFHLHNFAAKFLLTLNIYCNIFGGKSSCMYVSKRALFSLWRTSFRRGKFFDLLICSLQLRSVLVSVARSFGMMGIRFGSKKSDSPFSKIFFGKTWLTKPDLSAISAVTNLSQRRISFASLVPNYSGKVNVLAPSGL